MFSRAQRSSLFTSLFALFIYDLFDEVKNWSAKYRQAWTDYILDFQDQKTGYFIDHSLNISNSSINKKGLYQLNTFCLSALGILGAKPKYSLRFLKEYSKPEYLKKYLKEYRCLNGSPGSGNFAMFLGVFLSYGYKNNKNVQNKIILKDWFKKHDDQIKKNGTWGDSYADHTVWGFQNALHQLIIYNFWKKATPNITTLIKKVLSLQDKEGHYGHLPGGSGCFDYDASFILLRFSSERHFKQVYNQSLKLYNSILLSQNNDGGFCETNKYPKNLIQLLIGVKNYSNDYNLISLVYRLREMVRHFKKEKQYHSNHWSEELYKLEESDLWNTWFRLLTIAQIEKTYIKNVKWNFHKTIGLGYF